MKRPATHVTDHAIIRYLERVVKMDIEGLRREIGHKVERGVDRGACGVRLDGFCYKLRGGTVTTVAPACRQNKRAGRKPRTGAGNG